MEQNPRLKRYNELFPDCESKATAFDKIAEQYYAGNFGRMSKADIETLLFSIYIEQILKKSEEDFFTYSDFRLAKELGLAQSKISNLKVKKQLQYPYNFNWRKSFARVSDNVQYENGKIKIHIHDINLYYEIKNAVEENGGYIEVTLTPKLLLISPSYFLDLLVVVTEEENRDALRKMLRQRLRQSSKDKEYIEAVPFGKQVATLGKEVTLNLIETIATEKIGIAAEIAKKVLSVL